MVGVSGGEALAEVALAAAAVGGGVAVEDLAPDAGLRHAERIVGARDGVKLRTTKRVSSGRGHGAGRTAR